MAHLIIKRGRPFQIFVTVVVLSLLLSSTIWFLLDESHRAFVVSRVALGQETRRLAMENHKLHEKVRRLEEQVVILERAAQVDQQAAANVHEQMKALQDDIYRLKEELVFYQGVVSATGSSDGLRIQSMRVVPLPEPRNYHFKLILTHVAKDDIVAEGTIDILLEGMEGKIPRELKFADIGIGSDLDLSFKFKNFKRIEGNLILPDGFTPHRVNIRLQPKNSRYSSVKKMFNWSEMVG